MTDLDQLKEDIVTANRILADHNVVDSFGHVSVRHPDNPARFLLSRARAPACIELGDIMEFTLDGEVVGPAPGKPYSERFIHGAILAARPEVMAVVHNHSPNIVPFSVVKTQCFCAIMHMAAPVGRDRRRDSTTVAAAAPPPIRRHRPILGGEFRPHRSR